MAESTAVRQSRVMAAAEKISTWVVLNICFLLTSLAGVTVLASAVALQTALAEPDDSAGSSRAYFRAFRSAWRRCWPLSVALPFVAVAGFVSMFFYLTSAPVARVGALVVLIPTLSLAIAGYLAFLQVAATTPGEWRTWLRAVPGLLLTRPLQAAAAVLLLITVAALASRLPTLIPIGCGVAPALIARWAFGPRPAPRIPRAA